MKRHREDIKPLTEINVTNLLDTAFVLLMAFMLVAPSIKYGIDLTLPTVAGSSMDSTQKTLTVTIQKRGDSEQIVVEDRRLVPADLTELLRRKRIDNPKLDIVLEADKEIRYEIFAKALGAIKDAGIENIGLLTEPPEPEKRTAS